VTRRRVEGARVSPRGDIPVSSRSHDRAHVSAISEPPCLGSAREIGWSQQAGRSAYRRNPSAEAVGTAPQRTATQARTMLRLTMNRLNPSPMGEPQVRTPTRFREVEVRFDRSAERKTELA
jgi:hypothetical protein